MIPAAMMFCCAQAQPTNAPDRPQQADAEYRKGQAAEKAGDPAAARDAYARALQLQPSHPHARYSLNQLKLTGKSIAAKGREAQFAAIPLAEYKIEGATLREALDLLSASVRDKSDKEVNFVIHDPNSRLADAKITLSLKSAPAGAVLRYITQQAGAKVRYEEHAIIIYSNQSS
ncbi:MAG: tetratricopeptide repeat protein [Verrucomicrobiota bacterium]